MAAERGATRFMQKRAGAMLPIAVGTQIPSIVENAMNRARRTEHILEEGAEGKLAGAFGDIKAEMPGAFGKGLGGGAAVAVGVGAMKLLSSIKHFGDGGKREEILRNLKKTDPVISQADGKVIAESYASMARFAPVLSTDVNAVRSFLRQAVMSGSGPDFMSLKLLGDAEKSVTGGGDKHR